VKNTREPVFALPGLVLGGPARVERRLVDIAEHLEVEAIAAGSPPAAVGDLETPVGGRRIVGGTQIEGHLEGFRRMWHVIDHGTIYARFLECPVGGILPDIGQDMKEDVAVPSGGAGGNWPGSNSRCATAKPSPRGRQLLGGVVQVRRG